MVDISVFTGLVMIDAELKNALQAQSPTYFKGLISPDTVSECLAFCEDEDALVLRALKLRTLSMYDSNFAQTGSKVVFPDSVDELMAIREQGAYGGFTIGAVEGLSAAVNGLRVVLKKCTARWRCLQGSIYPGWVMRFFHPTRIAILFWPYS